MADLQGDYRRERLEQLWELASWPEIARWIEQNAEVATEHALICAGRVVPDPQPVVFRTVLFRDVVWAPDREDGFRSDTMRRDAQPSMPGPDCPYAGWTGEIVFALDDRTGGRLAVVDVLRALRIRASGSTRHGCARLRFSMSAEDWPVMAVWRVLIGCDDALAGSPPLDGGRSCRV